jgi:hypothetical protein
VDLKKEGEGPRTGQDRPARYQVHGPAATRALLITAVSSCFVVVHMFIWVSSGGSSRSRGSTGAGTC